MGCLYVVVCLLVVCLMLVVEVSGCPWLKLSPLQQGSQGRRIGGGAYICQSHIKGQLKKYLPTPLAVRGCGLGLNCELVLLGHYRPTIFFSSKLIGLNQKYRRTHLCACMAYNCISPFILCFYVPPCQF